MPALNKVQLIGNLGKDPEVRYTPSGKKVCTYTVAVNRRWKGAEGIKESTDWFNVETWGRLGEISMDYLHKGSLVYLEGRLQTDRYEHEGETRFFTKVVAARMQLLDRKEEEVAVEEEEPIIE
jgi:single-strand DNA-binding protein